MRHKSGASANACSARANKNKIEVKNGLENFCFTMRNTLQEEKLKDKNGRAADKELGFLQFASKPHHRKPKKPSKMFVTVISFTLLHPVL